LKYCSVILVLVCLLLQFSGKSQEDWSLKKDKNGIKVFTRKTKNFKVDEIKVECEFNGRISQQVAVILDVNKHYEWVYKAAKTQFLKKNSDADVFFYTEIMVPWPFQNRDLIARLKVVQNSSNKVVMIESNGVNDFIPEKKHIVRIKYSRSNWIITPLVNKKFRVEYRVQVDPGDGVPAWLLNLFIANGPYETFLKLKEQIQLPQYVNARFPFITD